MLQEQNILRTRRVIGFSYSVLFTLYCLLRTSDTASRSLSTPSTRSSLDE